jgi:hypothetical protein
MFVEPGTVPELQFAALAKSPPRLFSHLTTAFVVTAFVVVQPSAPINVMSLAENIFITPGLL